MILAPAGPRPQGAAQGRAGRDPQGRLRPRARRRRSARRGPACRELAPRKKHTIEAVVDRVVIREGVEAAAGRVDRGWRVRHGDGLVLVVLPAAGRERLGRRGQGVWHDELFSTLYACPHCKISFEELEPRTFSFNSPYGACPACEGLGGRVQFDPELVLPDDEPVAGRRRDRALEGRHARRPSASTRRSCGRSSSRPASDWNTPLAQLSAATSASSLLHGDGKASFLGVLTLLEKEYATTPSRREARSGWKRSAARSSARSAAGRGCGPRPAACRVGGQAIHEITAHDRQRSPRASSRRSKFDERRAADRRSRSRSEIDRRLEFLDKVGVDYLTLDRPADTLSGGELQRVRLATGIGSGLVGVCYVLDEPSIGLHPRDNQRLIDALRDLQEQGNTVLVVEHDEAIMRSADWLIDIGPGAGAHGGRIVAAGHARRGRRATRLRSPAATSRGELTIHVPARSAAAWPRRGRSPSKA